MAKKHTIIHKRSAVEGKAPNTGSLSLGELAINTKDGKVWNISQTFNIKFVECLF